MTFHLPQDVSDWFKLLITLVIIGSAIFIQVTTRELPEWLITVVTAVISYYFGLTSNNKQGNI